jgi:anhydro-N-acetylmuramic acid kinase
MSGTSVDGLDLAACRFTIDKTWKFEILKAVTIPYSPKWIARLSSAAKSPALELARLNVDFGKFIGKKVARFCDDMDEKPGLVSSHGHTVFHQPHNRLTVQVGSGAAIAALTGLPTVCDFRSLDVALMGQGAPLVPIGDELLFGDYDFCLNLGGIANISYRAGKERRAFDICPMNMALNHFTRQLGYAYDPDGNLGRSGKVHNELLALLNANSYYQQKEPKSFGREQFESDFLPLVSSFQLSTPDILRTLYEHISEQLALASDQFPKGRMLITGGGAHNVFMIELFSEKTRHKIVVPSAQIIDFKEAVIFAFLGVLRHRNEVNVLHTATGSLRDHSGGTIYLPGPMKL